MRQALSNDRFDVPSRKQVLPAPFGGWNARDSIAEMRETDAVVFDNFFADNDGVRVRDGDTDHVTGLDSDVETLFTHRSPTGEALLAATSDKIYDVSNTASQLGVGFTNARWQATNFNGVTILVNGADAEQSFNGTTLSDPGFTFDPSGDPDLDNVAQVRNRLWFAEKDSADAWYGEIGAIAGCLKKFFLSQIASGGKLQAIGSVSQDTGQGPDDFTVFVMDTGQVIVYQGDVATTFSLVGKYSTAPPLGKRSIFNLDGDLIILTETGYQSLGNIIAGRNSEISGKISNAVTSAANSNFGWQGLVSGSNIVINVPVTTNSEYEQHVLNRVIGSWSRFTGRNARQFANYQGDLYFGGDAKVHKVGGTTDASNSGNGIKARCHQAFRDLGTRTQIDMIRLWAEAGGVQTVKTGVRKDFDTDPITFGTTTFAKSDPSGVFIPAGIRANSVSVVADLTATQSFKWHRTDLLTRRGGFL